MSTLEILLLVLLIIYFIQFATSFWIMVDYGTREKGGSVNISKYFLVILIPAYFIIFVIINNIIIQIIGDE